MVLRATPMARAVAATPPWPALCASAATCNRPARSSSDGRTASNRSAMGFSSIIPPPYRDHGAARITQPLEAPTDALISGRRLIGLLLAGGCARSPDARALDDTATHLRLAQLAEAEGNAKEELALLPPAAARDPGNITLQTRYATAPAQTGQNQQAHDVALPAYARDKSNTGLGLLVG